MCLAIPGKILDLEQDGENRLARVEFGGITRKVSLDLVPEAGVGDYVIVHVGFAISKVDEEEALRTLELLQTMGDLVQQELATMGPGMAAPAVLDDPVRTGSPPAPAATLAGDPTT